MDDVSYAAAASTVDAHVAAENAQTLDAIMATWSKTVEVVLSYNQIPVRGLEAVERSYAARVGQLPPFAFEEVARFRGEDSIVTEQVLRFTGDDGAEVTGPSVVIYTFDDVGLLVEERVYLNELPLAPYFYPHLWKNRMNSDPSITERSLRRAEGAR